MSTVRITKEDKERFNLISKQMNMTQEVLLGYLVDQVYLYKIFDEGWVDQLVESRFHVMLLEADIGYRKTFEIDKHRAILDTKKMLLKELMKTLEPEEKRNYLESVLGDPTSGADLLENMASFTMFTVNGEKRFLPPGSGGFPRIVGIPPSQLVRCTRGFHTLNSSCPGCDVWKTCEILREERIIWLAEHGTKAEQEAYINETSGVRRLR